MLAQWCCQKRPSAACSMHDGTTYANNHNSVRSQTTKVDNASSKETINMKCSIEGCSGEYEQRKIVHTVRHEGQVVVIDHVPAEVCSVCGDVLLRPETIRRIEELLQTEVRPACKVPLYEYA